MRYKGSSMPWRKTWGGGGRVWTYDELILVLDFHLRQRDEPSANFEFELAVLVQNLTHLVRVQTSIRDHELSTHQLKRAFEHFKYLDPHYSRRSRPEPPKRVKEVWEKYAERSDELKALAETLLDCMRRGSLWNIPTDIDVAIPVEGILLTRWHRYRERSIKKTAGFKAGFRTDHGRLFCEACDNDFSIYGDAAADCFELHDTTPLAELHEFGCSPKPKFVLLCANCHRLVHAKAPWLSFDKLKSSVLESLR